MSLIREESWDASRQGTQISRKAEQLCPDSCNTCLSSHVTNRNDLALHIKRKLNKHSVITYSGPQQAGCEANRGPAGDPLCSHPPERQRSTGSTPIGLLGSHIQQVNKQRTKHKGGPQPKPGWLLKVFWQSLASLLFLP